jgi:hypothetical protein
MCLIQGALLKPFGDLSGDPESIVGILSGTRHVEGPKGSKDIFYG